MTENTKKWLTVAGCLVVCAILVAVIASNNHMDIILIEFITWFVLVVILGIFVCSVIYYKYRKNKNGKNEAHKKGQNNDERKI